MAALILCPVFRCFKNDLRDLPAVDDISPVGLALQQEVPAAGDRIGNVAYVLLPEHIPAAGGDEGWAADRAQLVIGNVRFGEHQLQKRIGAVESFHPPPKKY